MNAVIGVRWSRSRSSSAPARAGSPLTWNVRATTGRVRSPELTKGGGVTVGWLVAELVAVDPEPEAAFAFGEDGFEVHAAAAAAAAPARKRRRFNGCDSVVVLLFRRRSAYGGIVACRSRPGFV